jgi:hypothetical protein
VLFFTIELGKWLSSQVFTHVLRDPGLIPSTIKIGEKWLEFIIGGSVICFWAAFIIEAPLFLCTESCYGPKGAFQPVGKEGSHFLRKPFNLCPQEQQTSKPGGIS